MTCRCTYIYIHTHLHTHIVCFVFLSKTFSFALPSSDFLMDPSLQPNGFGVVPGPGVSALLKYLLEMRALGLQHRPTEP